MARFRSLSDPPDEIEIEFGIQLSGSVGAFIASGSAQANFKLTLAWRRPGGSG